MDPRSTRGNFHRGSEATSSVRLRRRKEESPSNAVKKKNRHSGDFLYWPMKQQQQQPPQQQQMLQQPLQQQQRYSSHLQPPQQQFRQSGDWALYNMSPSGLYPSQSPHRSYVSPSTEDRNPYTRQQQQQPPQQLLLQQRHNLEDLLNSQCSMETLDRKIPPSVRPANQETFSIGDENMLRLQQQYLRPKDNNNNKSGHNNVQQQQQQFRRSCDVSQVVTKHLPDHYPYHVEPKRRDLRIPNTSTQSDVGRRPHRARPVSASATSLGKDMVQQQQQQQQTNEVPLVTRAGKKYGKSTDAVHHHLNQLKRSYPDLREAVSESGLQFMDDRLETSTNVSTVVAQQSTVIDCGNGGNSSTVRKGLLWQQRDKIFSRWKERFFILTQDYLQCFKRGSSQITEMGGFIFKLRLSEVEEVELVDKRGYLTISLNLNKDGKLLLRKPEGIREWYQSIQECVLLSKERRGLMKSTKEFWSKKQFTDSSSMEHWLLARQRVVGQPFDQQQQRYSGSSSAVALNEKKTIDYGFIDAPPPPLTRIDPDSSSGEKEHHHHHQSPKPPVVAAPVGVTKLPEATPPPPYEKNSQHDSASNKSQDSGIDSIEKPGRCSSPFGQQEKKETKSAAVVGRNSTHFSGGVAAAVDSKLQMEMKFREDLKSEYLHDSSRDLISNLSQLWQKRELTPREQQQQQQLYQQQQQQQHRRYESNNNNRGQENSEVQYVRRRHSQFVEEERKPRPQVTKL